MTMGTHFNSTNPSGVRALPLAAGRNEGGHYFPDKLWRWQIDQKNILNILPPQEYLVFVFLNEKCLEFSDLARKLIRKSVRQFYPLPPDMCAKNLILFNFVVCSILYVDEMISTNYLTDYFT